MVNIVEPSFEILDLDKIDGIKICKKLEKIGRVAYKSENKITEDSYKDFLNKIINSGHESVLEHVSVSVSIICDRGISHELVRHRLCSFTQESTRFANYTNKKFNNEITVILPLFFKENSQNYTEWKHSINVAESYYLYLIQKGGAKPEEARSVLPNSLKTEIVITCNLRQWKHIFNLRCAKKAHPQMREIMLPLLIEFHKLIPIIFDDLYEKYIKNMDFDESLDNIYIINEHDKSIRKIRIKNE